VRFAALVRARNLNLWRRLYPCPRCNFIPVRSVFGGRDDESMRFEISEGRVIIGKKNARKSHSRKAVT
jgi:hypothetical protein